MTRRIQVPAVAFMTLITLFAASGFGQFVVPNNDEAERSRARAAAVAAARGQVQRAEQLLNVAQQRVQANWNANPQYQALLKEQADARKEFGAARDQLLEKLKDDPRYTGAKQAEADASDDLHDAQAKTNATQPSAAPGTANPPDPSPQQFAAAQDKLNSKTKLRKLVDDAVAADPAAAKARARLDQANSDLQVLSLQLKAALLNDADYKSALDQLTAARAQVTQAASSN